MISAGTIGMPLHFGKVPNFLSERMGRMGDAIIESDAHEKPLKVALDSLLPQDDTRPVPPTGCKEESSFEAHATTLFVARKAVQHVPQEIQGDRNTYLILANCPRSS